MCKHDPDCKNCLDCEGWQKAVLENLKSRLRRHKSIEKIYAGNEDADHNEDLLFERSQIKQLEDLISKAPEEIK